MSDEIAKKISSDLTDDEDPANGEKISEIHRRRYAKHSDVVGLVENLGSCADNGVTSNAASKP